MAPDRGARGESPGRAPGEQLDDAILRSTPEFNALEVAAETGLTIEQTRRS
jgi:adenylate cyclase